MSHVILGLLLIAPRSYYDLIKGFEAGVSLFYSASSGSIKRALGTLLGQGLVEVAAGDPGPRGRKVYRVTDAGRAEFHSWMRGELGGPDLETAALSRLFFLGLLAHEERAPVLRRIVGRIESDLAQLEALHRRLETAEVQEEHRDVATHHFATLDYGLASHRFALEWFRRHLARHEQPPSPDKPAP